MCRYFGQHAVAQISCNRFARVKSNPVFRRSPGFPASIQDKAYLTGVVEFEVASGGGSKIVVSIGDVLEAD